MCKEATSILMTTASYCLEGDIAISSIHVLWAFGRHSQNGTIQPSNSNLDLGFVNTEKGAQARPIYSLTQEPGAAQRKKRNSLTFLIFLYSDVSFYSKKPLDFHANCLGYGSMLLNRKTIVTTCKRN